MHLRHLSGKFATIPLCFKTIVGGANNFDSYSFQKKIDYLKKHENQCIEIKVYSFHILIIICVLSNMQLFIIFQGCQ